MDHLIDDIFEYILSFVSTHDILNIRVNKHNDKRVHNRTTNIMVKAKNDNIRNLQLINIRSIYYDLNMNNYHNIFNRHIIGLNILITDLTDNIKISDVGVSSLTNITKLNLSRNNKINPGYDKISRLVNIVDLNLAYNNRIADYGIPQIINIINSISNENYSVACKKLKY